LTVSLSPNQSAPNVNVVLKKGALITVHVIDSAQSLSSNEGKTQGAHLLLGVSSDAMVFRSAGIVSQDASGRNYQFLIPFDRTVILSVASAFFHLADAAGRPLPKSGLIPVLVPTGQQPPMLVLMVAGVAKP
jgi:hypothetical protein